MIKKNEEVVEQPETFYYEFKFNIGVLALILDGLLELSGKKAHELIELIRIEALRQDEVYKQPKIKENEVVKTDISKVQE